MFCIDGGSYGSDTISADQKIDLVFMAIIEEDRDPSVCSLLKPDQSFTDVDAGLINTSEQSSLQFRSLETAGAMIKGYIDKRLLNVN